ncbi:MAG: TIGR02466 family protein [Pseudomonadota bacterium]
MLDDHTAANITSYQGLFETPVLTAELSDIDHLLAELKALILQRRKTHTTDNRSGKGGWQSDIGMLQWGGEPARTVGIQMMQMCNQYTTDVGQTDPQKPRFEWTAEMWANVNPAGGGHESHTHPGAIWSTVFFVDNGLETGEPLENAGELVLQDPKNPLPIMYKPDLRFRYGDRSVYRSDHRFTPQAGRIIAFPSWLAHWVTPHRGTGDRISIAMNLMALDART